MATTQTSAPTPIEGSYRTMARGFAALRIFMGLVWVSNALAKVFSSGSLDLGFFSFNLITRDAAQRIATNAASKTQIAPLGAFYRDVVIPNWGFFGIFLTSPSSPWPSACCSVSRPASPPWAVCCS